MKNFRTIYNHEKPVSPSGDKSLTDQQYKNECDVNSILKSFRATGQIPNAKPTGISGDFSDIGDFSQCLERINRAKDEFAALPSHIRDRFGNDPSSYVDFVLDPANVDECVRLGLREKPVPPEVTAVDVLKEIKEIVTPKGEKPAQ